MDCLAQCCYTFQMTVAEGICLFAGQAVISWKQTVVCESECMYHTKAQATLKNQSMLAENSLQGAVPL